MNIRWPGPGVAMAALSLILGCASSSTQDGGPDAGPDAGPIDDCVPADGGYCGVCHFMTACGEYPPGPYGMRDGLVLPPCFQDVGFWNPLGIILNDGGNPVPMQSVPFFQDLYCSSFHGQRYALIQVVTTDDHISASQGAQLARNTDGPDAHWLQSGGQVMQIIEQSNGGFPPSQSDVLFWATNYGTSYNLAADTGQVLQPLIDANGGWPVTYFVNLQTMKIRLSSSYAGDFGQIVVTFEEFLDGGMQ